MIGDVTVQFAYRVTKLVAICFSGSSLTLASTHLLLVRSTRTGYLPPYSVLYTDIGLVLASSLGGLSYDQTDSYSRPTE